MLLALDDGGDTVPLDSAEEPPAWRPSRRGVSVVIRLDRQDERGPGPGLDGGSRADVTALPSMTAAMVNATVKIRRATGVRVHGHEAGQDLSDEHRRAAALAG